MLCIACKHWRIQKLVLGASGGIGAVPLAEVQGAGSHTTTDHFEIFSRLLADSIQPVCASGYCAGGVSPPNGWWAGGVCGRKNCKLHTE